MTEGGYPVEDRPRATVARAVGVVVALVRAIGGAAATVLVAHIVLTVAGANPVNGVTQFVAEWADELALWFHDLFTPADERLRVILNYGAAALFWLAVTGVVSRILRRSTSPYLIS